MESKFDELAKGMARSVTRRAALKKFGLGLAGFALAALGVATTAKADTGGKALARRVCNNCVYPYGCGTWACVRNCYIYYCSHGGH